MVFDVGCVTVWLLIVLYLYLLFACWFPMFVRFDCAVACFIAWWIVRWLRGFGV